MIHCYSYTYGTCVHIQPYCLIIHSMSFVIKHTFEQVIYTLMCMDEKMTTMTADVNVV